MVVILKLGQIPFQARMAGEYRLVSVVIRLSDVCRPMASLAEFCPVPERTIQTELPPYDL